MEKYFLMTKERIDNYAKGRQITWSNKKENKRPIYGKRNGETIAVF